jgi:hypothetical protein
MEELELEEQVDLARPPAGVWRESDGLGTRMGATHRSLGAAGGLLAACLFWNGIVSVFVLLALASTLRLLGVEVPHWFPAPEMDKQPMGVGMTIFLWIFLTPFIAIGTALLVGVLMSLVGRTEVEVSHSEGVVRTGVGVLSWRRRFIPSQVKDVRVEMQRGWSRGNESEMKPAVVIEQEDGQTVSFGRGLSDARRDFLALSLRQLLVR